MDVNVCQHASPYLSIGYLNALTPAKIRLYIPIWTHMFGLSNWAPQFHPMSNSSGAGVLRFDPFWWDGLKILENLRSYHHGFSMFHGIIIVLTLTIGLSLSSQNLVALNDF